MNDSFLQEQGVSGALIESVRRFRESYPVAEGLENRMSTPEIPFFGKEILEMAIAALLQGENLLLTGEKATGKTCWQRHWRMFSEDRRTTFPSM